MDIKALEEAISHEIYNLRVLLFIEAEPLTNRYYQILLNRDQFKKVSDALPYDQVKQALLVSDEEYKLPDLKQIDYQAAGIENANEGNKP